VNIAVWIASVLLAAAYLFIGGTKLLKSKERLAENPSTAGAAEALSATSIKLIGGVEVAGALGLIVPWLTGIAPILALAVFIAAARTAEVV
jgi:hypothetical protein